jgi:RNA polymerase sigma-70 factor (ECF subfamily)
MPDLQIDYHETVEAGSPDESGISPRELTLVSQAQRGDEQAFGELYEIWAAKVYRFIYSKVKSIPVAEDITADVFLKAWQKLHQYKPRTGISFSSWLYTIARNGVVDYYRMNQRSELSFEDLPEMADLEGEELYREKSEIEQALKSLPEEYEKVLRLRFVEQLPIARVAQIMKKKEDNIRALTSRALKKLKDQLHK